MTQGQTERLIADARRDAEDFDGSLLGERLLALLRYVAELQSDNANLLQQRDAAKAAQVTMHCPQCEARGRNLVDTIRQDLGMAGACDPHSYIAVGTEIFGPVFTLNVGVSNEGCDGGGHNDE